MDKEKKKKFHRKNIYSIDKDAPIKSKEISDRHQRFVDEYLIDLSPSKAYKRAGFKAKQSSAYVCGLNLLKRPEVQEAIQKGIDERSQRTHVSQDRVIKELAKIAFSNMKSFISWNRSGVTVRDSSQISDDDAAVIQELNHQFNDYGSQLKFKLYDKQAALMALGNHLGMFKEDASKSSEDSMLKARKIRDALKQMDEADAV